MTKLDQQQAWFKSLSNAHFLVCWACGDMANSKPWWAAIPLIGRRWRKGFRKLNRVRRYLLGQIDPVYRTLLDMAEGTK